MSIFEGEEGRVFVDLEAIFVGESLFLEGRGQIDRVVEGVRVLMHKIFVHFEGSERGSGLFSEVPERVGTEVSREL